MFKRLFLFVAVNILIIVTLSIVMNLLGVNYYLNQNGIDYQSLLIFSVIWGFGGAFISLAISRWIAKLMMGVKVIDPNKCSPQDLELYNMVSSLSQKAGLDKVPEVGIYESPDLNAFATGPSKSRSLVAVSRGLLNNMGRQELEGVLGHEVAHIANGDMVTMTLLQGVVNVFVLFFARVIAFFASQFVKDDMRPFVNFIIIIILEILLSILGFLVVAWFSRRREFRADEGGAMLAGKQSMISALETLKNRYNPEIARAVSKHEPASVATLKINGKKSTFLSLFSTHPPIDERIARLKELPSL